MSYGSGSIYQRGKVWWISYTLDGVRQFESSKSKDRKDAAAMLRKRQGEMSAKKALAADSRILTVPDLLNMLDAHYIEKECRSIADLRGKIRYLSQYFHKVRAAEFGTHEITKFKTHMRTKHSTDATINRYLAVLRRAFNLAAKHDPPLVARVPNFQMLAEDNARTGFVTDQEYRTVLNLLPDHLKGLMIFGYHLGMRREALKNLRRDQVDWPAKIIRTEPPKGAKKQGRVLPIYGDMVPWLEAQMATWDQIPSRWIFHMPDGSQIGLFRKSWKTACRLARMPHLLFHDLRRSAVRNLENAGVPRSQAMAITGHKTDSVFHRYAIVSERDVVEAGEKLKRLQDEGRKENSELA